MRRDDAGMNGSCLGDLIVQMAFEQAFFGGAGAARTRDQRIMSPRVATARRLRGTLSAPQLQDHDSCRRRASPPSDTVVMSRDIVHMCLGTSFTEAPCA